ncbi:hypothetical protein IFM89_008280 [Coptis chinensis]|uniref:non-specific serine/threonine protein kinase n=1 Tax=Coptis chinensis TaxID=261450 RepID=A0A835GXA9_9MAGN|nr:hypothetical protein IFM89_008280 [Coptis chinensis]
MVIFSSGCTIQYILSTIGGAHESSLVLVMVDPHDSLSHPTGVSDVQAESNTSLDPNQFTNFLIPNWFGEESSLSTKQNHFPLPEHQSLEEIKQALQDIPLEENRKWELSCALHVYLKDCGAECAVESSFIPDAGILSAFNKERGGTTGLVFGYNSLDRWLHKRKRESIFSDSVNHVLLDWPTRLHIAVGVAQGLCYMHHGCSQSIIHCDVKSSNILLDANFNATIADFGLAKMLVKHGESDTMSAVAGSYGYIAPKIKGTTSLEIKARSQLVFEVLVRCSYFRGTKPVVFGVVVH